jgi:hypothetical protein
MHPPFANLGPRCSGTFLMIVLLLALLLLFGAEVDTRRTQMSKPQHHHKHSLSSHQSRSFVVVSKMYGANKAVDAQAVHNAKTYVCPKGSYVDQLFVEPEDGIISGIKFRCHGRNDIMQEFGYVHMPVLVPKRLKQTAYVELSVRYDRYIHRIDGYGGDDRGHGPMKMETKGNHCILVGFKATLNRNILTRLAAVFQCQSKTK